MKIIISHDVDHLFAADHMFKDLILEKLWVRSFLYLLQGKIGLKTFLYRLFLLLHNRMTRIDEVIKFDKEHGIPSVFFFGMANGLGMSYSQKRALPFIRKVIANGFDAGVHGIDYIRPDRIKKEHDDFSRLAGKDVFGIRNHYVRFQEETFSKMNEAGYLFDSTWFNKNTLELRKPYKVGNMWEFPLHIMDGYICKEGKLKEGIRAAIQAVEKADRMGMPYCTILFHDYLFDDKFSPQMKRWYIETVKYCEKKGYEFISYRQAIEEMER